MTRTLASIVVAAVTLGILWALNEGMWARARE